MIRQLAMPWALRALMRRPLTPPEEFLEMLSMEAEPLVAKWARSVQGSVREVRDLAIEVERLEGSGGPVAELVGRVVRSEWREFGGSPLRRRVRVGLQDCLPLN